LAKKLNISKSEHKLTLIGLACSAADYRLLYFVGKVLGFSFSKLADLPLYGKTEKLGDFSFYHFYREDHRLNFYLFANNKEGQIALPAHRNLDYFLLIDSEISPNILRDLLLKIRSIPILQAAMQIPLSSLKDLDLLMEDIELHLIALNKTQKEKVLLWEAIA
jgi:hypothetical protein